MPDILIRGMEMPKVCIDNGWYGNCPMDRSWCAQRFAPKDSTNESAHKDQWNKLPSWCPLVPIPEGHGRLIDADAVVKTICNSCDGACDVVQCDCLNCKADCRCDIVKEISDAPTIIEADLEWKMNNCCCFSNTDQAEGGGEDG